MNSLVLLSIIPILAGFLGLFISWLRNEFNFLGTILNLYYATYLFIITRKTEVLYHKLWTFRNIDFGFYLDQFSSVIVLSVALIGFMILLYSLRSMRNYRHLNIYYLFLLITISIGNSIIIANNLIFLFLISVISLLVLYIFILITAGGQTEKEIVKLSTITNPMFLIVGISNVFILSGILMLLFSKGVTSIISEPRLVANTPVLVVSFLLILLGIIGKIGIIPLHTWTLKIVKSPVTVMTFIPMVIDKIVGIYLLFRISYFIFDIRDTYLIRLIILGFGALSIVIASVVAKASKDAYRLLTFGSISQIGFVFIGIGSANLYGIAGSIYHLLNYLTFQPSLVLATGSVEYWIKTTRLEDFHNIGTKLPLTFTIILIASLASIGIPPLNGFFSKWWLIEGVSQIKMFNINFVPLIFLIVIIFGIIVTPIYLLKLIYSLQPNSREDTQRHFHHIRDPNFTMLFPPAFLVILSIILGVLVIPLVWRVIVIPSLINTKLFNIEIINLNPLSFTLAPVILIISILIGIVYYYNKIYPKRFRST
ncbi:MAG: proton-conducting transporter membrane subunit [candidate division WOR-3 bacterium]|nr:proton-conducting transporter membrane subunit [candidate division WOR-3 bacterium]